MEFIYDILEKSLSEIQTRHVFKHVLKILTRAARAIYPIYEALGRKIANISRE